jgi:hypothetical protein
MFTVTQDSWTHSYQSSSPELQCLRATDASSLPHQITDSPSHSFYAARSRWQIELRIFPIRSELIGPSQKLPDRHAHNARAHWFLNEPSQPLEHRFEAWTVRQLQRLASKPVEDLSHGSAYQFAFASASAPLQLTDEMKMTQLHDPALSRRQPDDPPNVVGNRGADASVSASGNRLECMRPALHILSAWQKHRIQEDRSILTVWLDRHQVKHPMVSPKAKVQSVENQDQRPRWQAQNARSRYEPPQSLTTTVPQRLRRKGSTWCEALQSSSLHQDCFQKHGRTSPTLAASFLCADAPCAFAMPALPTSRTEAIDLRSATGRFRVRRIHARELSTDWILKYGKSQTNLV